MDYFGKLVFEHENVGSVLKYLLSFFYFLFVCMYVSSMYVSIYLSCLLCCSFSSKHSISINLLNPHNTVILAQLL